jgi:DNA-binding NtrC family response regulator
MASRGHILIVKRGRQLEALGLLEAYEWRGNMREPESAVERAVMLCDETLVSRSHLPANIALRKESDGPLKSPVPAWTTSSDLLF